MDIAVGKAERADQGCPRCKRDLGPGGDQGAQHDHRGQDAGLEGDGPHREQSSAVQAVVSDSGPLDLLEQYRHGALRRAVAQFLGGPPELIADAWRPFLEIGFRHMVVDFASPHDRETLERLPEIRAFLD